MSILVTGGAGFIGSHCIERMLRDGVEQIICLDDFNNFYDPRFKRANVAGFANDPRVTIVEQSFCDLDAMRALFKERRFEAVIHLGALAGVRASVGNPAPYEHNNVGGTIALLAAAEAYPVRRFVLVSSSTVYGRDAAVPFQEDAPLGLPLSPYGVSKQGAELWGRFYAATYGVPVVSLRPFSVYGRRLRPDLAMYVFAEAILAGRSMTLYGDGTRRRDFTHIDDFCGGLLAALTAPGVVGEAINLGRSQTVEIREMISLLEQNLGRKAQIDYRESDPADMPVTFADLSKAQRLLGYEPRVTLADGVRDFVSWFHQRMAAL